MYFMISLNTPQLPLYPLISLMLILTGLEYMSPSTDMTCEPKFWALGLEGLIIDTIHGLWS